MRYIGVPWEDIWEPPASGHINTNPLGSAAAEGVEVTVSASLVIWSDPVEQVYGGTQVS